MARRDPAPARHDDGFPVGKQHLEAPSELARWPQVPTTVHVVHGWCADRCRDMAGSRIDRLDFAEVPLGRSHIEQRDTAELLGQLSAMDHSRPLWRERERGSIRVTPHSRAQLEPGRGPRLHPAVENGRATVVTQCVEHPPEPRRDRTGSVVARDDEVVVAKSQLAQPPSQRGRIGEGMPPGSAEACRIGEVGTRSTKTAPAICPASYAARPAPGRPMYQRRSATRTFDDCTSP